MNYVSMYQGPITCRTRGLVNKERRAAEKLRNVYSNLVLKSFTPLNTMLKQKQKYRTHFIKLVNKLNNALNYFTQKMTKLFIYKPGNLLSTNK